VDTGFSQSRPRFELGRGIVAERGVTPPPIVEHRKVLEDIRCRFVPSGVAPMVHELAFECPEKTFDTGIVPAVARAAHAAGDAVLAEQPLVSACRVLAAAIRVMEQPRHGLPMRQRHGEGPVGSIHGQPMAHRPADHGTRVPVEHQGEIEPALRRPNIGHVPGPHPVGLPDLELPGEGVAGHRPRVVRVGRGAPRLHGLGPDPFDAHPSRDAMCADPVPPLHQCVPDAGTAVGLARLSVDHSDFREQDAVVHCTAALGPILPGVIACSRYRERPAHEPEGNATVGRLDRAVSHGDSRAKNAAARCKKSRSWVTRANSRFTRVSASASARWAARVVPWAAACRCWAVQRYHTLSEIPRSRATWATG